MNTPRKLYNPRPSNVSLTRHESEALNRQFASSDAPKSLLSESSPFVRMRALSLRSGCCSLTLAISRSPKPRISKARQQKLLEKFLLVNARPEISHVLSPPAVSPRCVLGNPLPRLLSRDMLMTPMTVQKKMCSWDTLAPQRTVSLSAHPMAISQTKTFPGKLFRWMAGKKFLWYRHKSPTNNVECRIKYLRRFRVSGGTERVEGSINKNKREWQVAIKKALDNRRWDLLLMMFFVRLSALQILLPLLCGVGGWRFPRSCRNQSEEAALRPP